MITTHLFSKNADYVVDYDNLDPTKYSYIGVFDHEGFDHSDVFSSLPEEARATISVPTEGAIMIYQREPGMYRGEAFVSGTWTELGRDAVMDLIEEAGIGYSQTRVWGVDRTSIDDEEARGISQGETLR
jgi:hypothetical protein